MRRTDEECEHAVEEALIEVGLNPGDLLPKYAHQLSGGQLQRVMIARALVVGPELLIADEPTSMLDASLRVTVLNLLRDVGQRHNMSVLFITHDLGQAYYVCDRVLVMYRGELVEQGGVQEVLAAPQHEYTRRLLADVPRLHGWGRSLPRTAPRQASWRLVPPCGNARGGPSRSGRPAPPLWRVYAGPRPWPCPARQRPPRPPRSPRRHRGSSSSAA